MTTTTTAEKIKVKNGMKLDAAIVETGQLDMTVVQIELERPVCPKIPSRLLAVVLLIAAAAGSTLYCLDARHYEDTDDAQVDGHFADLSTRIDGTVAYINPNVENNHSVKAGDLLLELDSRDYKVALERAKANLKTRQAQERAAELEVPIVEASAYSQLRLAEAAREEAAAGVESAQAEFVAAQQRFQQDDAIAGRAERDRARYERLVVKREVSRSFYDARETEAQAAVQTLESDRAAVASAERKVAQMRSQVAQREAQVSSAKTAPQQSQNARASTVSAQGAIEQLIAEVHAAELNLSYTRIYAPVSGIIGHKTVELGHRIQPGQTLLTVVPMEDIWVTANFKETQLQHMRPGQPVTIHVDSFDRDYRGVIDELAGAAGPLFSLFPPENATGNYVKIVQRFPVRLHIDKGQDPQHQLRPGMSVEAKVKID